MTTSLVTSLHTETDICFAKTPDGQLFMTNGIDRGRKWNGSPDSTPVVIGIDAPTSAPTVTTPGSGGAEAGTYYLYYRFGDLDGNYSNLSPVAEVTAAASDQFSWDTVPVASGTDSSSRVTKRQLFRSLVDAPGIVYLVTTIEDNTTTSYTSDTLTDEALADREELPLLNDDDTVNANRFGLPPTTKPFCLFDQDRMFYFGDAVYSTGTVTFTNSSATISGSGTSFNRYMVGRYIYPLGSTRGYLISAYSSATSLTISETFSGSTLTGVAYEIRPAPGELNFIFFSEPLEYEAVPQAQNRYLIQTDPKEDDITAGGYVIGRTIFVAQQRNTYFFRYVRQPHLDGSSAHAFARGLFNHNCSAKLDNVMYCQDQSGPYAFSGGSAVLPIGDPIENYYRDGSVDFDYARRFWVGVSKNTKVVRFYVALTGDGGVKSAFCYHAPTQRWWVEKYPWIVGCGVSLRQGREWDYYVGKEDDRFCVERYSVASDGVSDGVAGVVQGTAGFQITATASIFVAGHVGCPIVLTSGAAKHEKCVITSRNSATNVAVDAIPAGLAAGDTFIVGGIPWNWKTGMMELAQADAAVERSVEVFFRPTDTDDNYLDVRHYMNYQADPQVAKLARKEGDGRCASENGSADGVYDIYKDKSATYETVGVCRKDFSARSAPNTDTDRFVSVELRGVTSGEPVEVSQVAVSGAK